MALNFLTLKNSNSIIKGASSFWMSLLVFLGISLHACFAFSQNTTQHLSINRYVTEVNLINESSILLSTNIMLTSTQSEFNNILSIKLPQGEDVKVKRSKIRITDAKGNVIWKGNGAKTIESGNIALKGINGMFDRNISFPLSIEWETAVIVYSINHMLTWPSINEANIPILYLGFRIFADDEILKMVQTNIPESSPLMDQSTGLRGLVWELHGYENKKALQNARPIENPFVKISF